MFFDHLSPGILGVEFKTVWFPKKKIETAAISFTKPTPIMSEHKSHLRAFSINQSLNCTNTEKPMLNHPPPPHISPPICDCRREKTVHHYKHHTTQCSGQQRFGVFDSIVNDIKNLTLIGNPSTHHLPALLMVVSSAPHRADLRMLWVINSLSKTVFDIYGKNLKNRKCCMKYMTKFMLNPEIQSSLP